MRVLAPRPRWNSQSGMTLVELMVAMAVGAIVMTALVGVVFAAANVSNAWSQRIYDARLDPLFSTQVQSDARRFLACSEDGPSLTFCTTDGRTAVTYTTASSCPCDVTRTVYAQDYSGNLHLVGSSIVARGLQAPPQYRPECIQEGAQSEGYVLISGVQYPGDSSARPNLAVFFRAPTGSCTS
jgi:prepilin-type N-terminal cleavage/methylation domain-containing protein